MRSRAPKGLVLVVASAALLLSGGPSSASAAVCSGPNVYPGDTAPKQSIAVWMARGARDRGIPGELPVMAALVESNLTNLNHGDSDAVGYFLMRTSIWNRGEYARYPDNPDLQLEWFIDQAIVVRDRAVAGGDTDFGADPNTWGEWVADVERPAEQYRYRYQLELGNARALIGELCTNPGGGPEPSPPTDAPTCNGKPATQVGTDAGDVIRGTRGADIIVALGGKDVVRAGGGDDVVCGGPGADRLSGGGGGDQLLGEGGADVLIGGAGIDRLRGGPGRDDEK